MTSTTRSTALIAINDDPNRGRAGQRAKELTDAQQRVTFINTLENSTTRCEVKTIDGVYCCDFPEKT